MKKILLFILIILLSGKSSLTNYNDNEVIKSFIKYWGFLKYYHPPISSKGLNWDSVFVNSIDKIKNIDCIKDYNDFLINIIESLPADTIINKEKLSNNNNCFFNFDEFFSDSLFNNKTKEILKEIYINKYNFQNQYVFTHKEIGCTMYDHELEYNIYLPDENYRLLALARTWNIVNFFYPYLNLLSEDWDSTLNEFIPLFSNSTDTIDFHLLIANLMTRLNDGHAFAYSKYINRELGRYQCPYEINNINGKTYIGNPLFDTLIKTSSLFPGDEIIKINGIEINELRNKLNLIIGGSTNLSKNEAVDYLISCAKDDTILIEIKRNGKMLIFHERFYHFSVIMDLHNRNPRKEIFKTFSNDISYIDMGLLQIENVDSIMKKAIQYKSIIFDLRDYPHNTVYQIYNYLSCEKNRYVRFLLPDINYPGCYIIDSSYTIGIDTNQKYNGDVVILINEATTSHGEFSALALTTLDNAVFIGRPTSGCDGNISHFKVPGNIFCQFSGIGTQTLDGQQIQRIGIQPDIYVEKSLKLLIKQKDVILERAIEFIKNDK